jgi:hypothetical protein
MILKPKYIKKLRICFVVLQTFGQDCRTKDIRRNYLHLLKVMLFSFNTHKIA